MALLFSVWIIPSIRLVTYTSMTIRTQPCRFWQAVLALLRS
ncbi:hypothetical protein [Neptunicella sp. SCSIO 80796]